MGRGKNFINPTVFDEILAQIETAQGGNYQDISTIYGDLSRLVVAIIASTPPKELQESYNKLGWGGNANVRAIHEAATQWYSNYHPELLTKIQDST